jgi:hypothetical protein
MTRYVYLTQADVQYVYEDLKQGGYFEWYITLKIIDETQMTYELLSKLTWGSLLNTDFISDTNSVREMEYEVSESLKSEMVHIMDRLGIESYDEMVVTSTAKELHSYLLKKYDPIIKYKEHGINFRINFFRDYLIDKNGFKTYSMREIIVNKKSDDGDDSTIEVEDVKKMYLYIAKHADKHNDKRPVYYRTKFWDKKIGRAKDVPQRMENLSNDKRHGGTHSPIYVLGLKSWIMPYELCHKLERKFHKMLEDRNTGGEWYEDYNDDLISIVEKEIKSLIKKGEPIFPVPITKENEDFTFLKSVDKSIREKNGNKKEDLITEYTL